MKIAIICLAYLGNPSGVYLLSKYFSHLDAHLFLHVDAKVSSVPYEPLRSESNVTILANRLEIFWGGFNTVEVAIRAIEFASHMAPFDRFIFTTEDSIPLVGPGEMEHSFATIPDWIAIHSKNPAWVWNRYERFFFFDSRATSFRYFEAEDRCLTENDLSRMDRLRLLMVEGKTPLPELYHGCGWWSLSQETVRTILERHYEDKRLRESFEFSAIPEEQYFHTIIGTSKVRRPSKNFMYVDWSRDSDVKPYVFSWIEQLRGVKEEYPELLFIRKTDLDSEEVAAFVEEQLQ